jgi:hypothetical protein
MSPSPSFRAASLVVTGFLSAILIAACGATGPSPDPTTSPAATLSSPAAGNTPAPSAPESPPMQSAAPASPGPSLPSQTTTSWGRIWDALPAGFPAPPGATAAEVDEPVSRAFDLPVGVNEAATFMQGALERATFSTLAVSGPLEDGSIVIDSVGEPSTGCRVETTVTPAGGLTRMTVRYGADCPFS